MTYSRYIKGTLRQRMTVMLIFIVLQGILLSGLVILLSSTYLVSFNDIMNDCYDINQLLVTYGAERDAFQGYVLYGGDTAYAAYLEDRALSTQALGRMDIPFAEPPDQFLLLQAIETTYATLRMVCDETVALRDSGEAYATAYDRALRVGEYIESYIKELLQCAIDQGQETYQQHMGRLRIMPGLFILSIVLSFVSIALWTRWMMRHVVTPIHRLTVTASALQKNQYDIPDLPAHEEDEISQLSQVVNEMKHSTARLVDSLRTQQEMESRLHTEEVRRMRTEAAMESLRLSLLQSQVNPHFLFNTLNIISRMAQSEQAPVTEELIVRLASLFRYTLQSAQEVVPLTSELKIVSDYIAIQQIRFGDRMTFLVRCEVDASKYAVPIFMLQPLIENAVIHGVSPCEEGGTITIDITSLADGALEITVRDTGVGMTKEKLDALLAGDASPPQQVSGLGLGNVRNRVKAYRAGSRFVINSHPGEGTRITITIPQPEEGDRT